MASLRPLALLLAGALVATGCEDDSVTLPGGGASRAIIEVTVDPNPVPGSQNPLTGAVSVGYNVTITEVNGLGGELLFVSSQIYDPETGLQVALNYFDGATDYRLNRGRSIASPEPVDSSRSPYGAQRNPGASVIISPGFRLTPNGYACQHKLPCRQRKWCPLVLLF